MKYYKYTVFDGEEEQTGIMCGSVNQIMAILVSKGYYIKDIRTATQSDIKIEQLKHFRNRLGDLNER